MTLKEFLETIYRKIETNDCVKLKKIEITNRVKNSPSGTPKRTMGAMVKLGTK